MRIIRSCVVLLGLLCTTFAPALAAEKYPNRPVHFIVSFAAGGSVNGGASIANDTVFWGSGYSNLGIPGMTSNNKFYAFTPGGK